MKLKEWKMVCFYIVKQHSCYHIDDFQQLQGKRCLTMIIYYNKCENSLKKFSILFKKKYIRNDITTTAHNSITTIMHYSVGTVMRYGKYQ